MGPSLGLRANPLALHAPGDTQAIRQRSRKAPSRNRGFLSLVSITGIPIGRRIPYPGTKA